MPAPTRPEGADPLSPPGTSALEPYPRSSAARMAPTSSPTSPGEAPSRAARIKAEADYDAISVLGGRHGLRWAAMPKPMMTGLSVTAFRRLASTEELVERLSRSPVTPIRLTP